MTVGRESHKLGATLVLGPRVPDEAAPSPGYRFIGWLASVGYFDVILSCQGDTRLEDSVRAFLPASRVKVLNRGDMQDDVIADLISSSSQVCKIVKLCGDSVSRTLLGTRDDVPPVEQPLIDAVKRRAGQDLVVVGADADDPVVAPLLPHDRPKLVEVDDFDISFRDLGLVAGRHLGLRRSQEKKTFEGRLAACLDTAANCLDELKANQLVEDLVKRIAALRASYVLCVDHSPVRGVDEIVARISEYDLLKDCSHGSIQCGPGATLAGVAPTTDAVTVAVVDSAAFSGKTLRDACAAAKLHFPNARVVPAAVVSSDFLADRAGSDDVLQEIVYAHRTSRDELSFPWGPTSATSMVERVVETLDGKHLLQIHRSPWGKREILVDQQPCSVRILTLEPGERTSLQRHALRDEMFVAFDDGIGFQMSGDELDRSVIEADPRLHSFILERHDYLMVPRGIWHRIRAPQSRVRVLEVAFGLYDEVEDIERVLDKYGRI